MPLHAFGWSKESSRWIGVHLSSQHPIFFFVPVTDYGVEWFRTILIKKDQEWLMVEFCGRVTKMLDAEPPIDEAAGRTAVVTFLTDGFEDVANMGFSAESGQALEELEALQT
eukprot:s1031_g16.t1